MNESLWGKIDTEKIITPKSILEKQGEFLKEATKKQVYIEVERDIVEERANENKELVFNFLFRGKDMENFSYKLFSIAHPIDLYPLTITLDEKTFSEILLEVANEIVNNNSHTLKINNEAQYIKILKFILSSNRVKNLIKGILGLSYKQRFTF